MADRIVADSDYVSGELRTAGKVSSDRIARVYAGVDRTRFRPITNSELVEGVRRRYHLPDQFYIFVGGLARGWKNLELIVRSYILSRGEPGLCLPVVITSGRPAGTRGYRALELIEKNQMGHVFRFVGRIADEDLPAAYSMARGLLYPSLYEGFGMPPLEAMACGTPVVASNTTALPEIIADAGILIDPTSPESLLAALGSLNDPTVRGQMIQKGFNRARQFSWEQTAEELANEIVTLGA
jgi:glycosyltransferase involved in cell wall biosynthesis